MTYAVQQDLIDRFGNDELLQVADRDGDQVVDATVVTKALEDADELIDSYIAKRYDLPLASVPARLVRLACDIARYYLHKDDPTESVETAYKDAVAFLRDVSAGKAELDVGGEEPTREGSTVLKEAPDRVFTNDTLESL